MRKREREREEDRVRTIGQKLGNYLSLKVQIKRLLCLVENIYSLEIWVSFEDDNLINKSVVVKLAS